MKSNLTFSLLSRVNEKFRLHLNRKKATLATKRMYRRLKG